MDLEFRHIAHAYGNNWALQDISFTAPQGEITCLLGSSGCGKSTLLNLAAGLLPVQHGSVHIGEALLADASHLPPPEKRPVGLVFQDGALFPHLTIAQNIGFGLPKGAGRDADIAVWLEQVGLDGLGDRYPHELSGGQQQRAALARAMAPEPQVLLMDEPFASVDIVLRRNLRRECRKLLHERAATVILVTHDPEEALDIGDRIAVIDRGRIVQFGTPDELYHTPNSAGVGAIFNDAQLVSAKRVEAGLETAFGLWPLSCMVGDPPETAELELLVKSDGFDLRLAASGGLTLRDIRRSGGSTVLVLANDDGDELPLDGGGDVAFDVGARIDAVPRASSVLAFPASPAS